MVTTVSQLGFKLARAARLAFAGNRALDHPGSEIDAGLAVPLQRCGAPPPSKNDWTTGGLPRSSFGGLMRRWIDRD
jgi:hypothetical protein